MAGMDANEAVISARGLSKTYGTHKAVDGLDLEVTRGEIFALLGPNGAGKTTTVEILEGYRQRDAGEVTVLGTDPAYADRAFRSRVGIVLQSATDFEELAVGEVVHHFARYYPNARDPDEVIDLVGLADKRMARTRTLSGGQRRRLDVALGILGRPELLFLDEPTTGFDPQARRQFWGLVEALAAENTTILLTTHYLDEAERLADRVGVIVTGRIVEVAPPAQLGGRQQAEATVRWCDAEGEHDVRTPTPSRVVADLSARFGGEVPDLTVTRPTLEDVYLQLIGGAA